jgi:hypothetical protein
MPPLTEKDAREVAAKVILEVRDKLPHSFLADHPILLDPGRIFNILEPGVFKVAFDKHVAFFQGVLNCIIQVTGVDAFVSPDEDQAVRKIYIKIGGDETHGVLIHEFIHWLSHPDFYPRFYQKGGKAPDIVEGTTEYFTRKFYPNRYFYQAQYEKVKAIGQLESKMYLALFQGDAASIQAVHDAY